MRVFNVMFLIQDKANETKTEYRVWNPFRSKIASAIVGGIGNIHI